MFNMKFRDLPRKNLEKIYVANQNGQNETIILFINCFQLMNIIFQQQNTKNVSEGSLASVCSSKTVGILKL